METEPEKEIKSISSDALKYWKLMYRWVQDEWFSHRELSKHVSRRYQVDRDLLIGLIDQWEAEGIAIKREHHCPQIDRRSVYCRFTTNPGNL